MVSRHQVLDKYLLKSQTILNNDHTLTISRSNTYVRDNRDFIIRCPVREMKQKLKMANMLKDISLTEKFKLENYDNFTSQYLNNINDSARKANLHRKWTPKTDNIEVNKIGYSVLESSSDFINIAKLYCFLQQVNQESHLNHEYRTSFPILLFLSHTIGVKNQKLCNYANPISVFSATNISYNQILINEENFETQNHYDLFWKILIPVVSIISSVITISRKYSLSITKLKSYSILFNGGSKINTTISTPLYRFSQDSTLLDQKDINGSESYSSENCQSLNKTPKVILSSKTESIITNRNSKSYRSEIDMFIGDNSLWRIMEHFSATFVEKLRDFGNINWETCSNLKAFKRVISNNFMIKEHHKFHFNKHVKHSTLKLHYVTTENNFSKNRRITSISEDFRTAKDSYNGQLKVHFKNLIFEIPSVIYQHYSESDDEMFSLNNQNGIHDNVPLNSSGDILDNILLQTTVKRRKIRQNKCNDLSWCSKINNCNKYSSKLIEITTFNIGRNYKPNYKADTELNDNNKTNVKDDLAQDKNVNPVVRNPPELLSKTSLVGIYNAYAMIYEPDIYNTKDNFEGKNIHHSKHNLTSEDFDNLDSTELKNRISFKMKMKRMLSGNRQRPSTAYIDLSSEVTRTVSESIPLPCAIEKQKSSCCGKREKSEAN